MEALKRAEQPIENSPWMPQIGIQYLVHASFPKQLTCLVTAFNNAISPTQQTLTRAHHHHFRLRIKALPVGDTQRQVGRGDAAHKLCRRAENHHIRQATIPDFHKPFIGVYLNQHSAAENTDRQNGCQLVIQLKQNIAQGKPLCGHCVKHFRQRHRADRS